MKINTELILDELTMSSSRLLAYILTIHARYEI